MKNGVNLNRRHFQAVYPLAIEIYKQDGGFRSGQTGEALSFEGVLARFSMRILNCCFEDIDTEMVRGLQELVTFLGHDWLVLWEIAGNGRHLTGVHCAAPDELSVPGDLLTLESSATILDRIGALRNIYLFEQCELLEKEIPSGGHLSPANSACAVIPLFVESTLIGALFTAVGKQSEWQEESLAYWQRVGELFTGILDRRRQLQILEKRVQFETLITDLSARLMGARVDDIDREILFSLGNVRQFFDGDRCGLVTVDSVSACCRIISLSSGDGIAPLSREMNLAEVLPWSYQWIVIQGKHKNLGRLEDLPPEASEEIAFWRARGTRSILSVPIFEEGKVTSLIAIHSVKKEQFWPDEYVTRLRLLGEICMGAIRRGQAELALKDVQHQLEEQLREIRLLKERVDKENLYLRTEAVFSSEHNEIVAESKCMRMLLTKARQVAQTDSTVLITGETGTGKELVAQYIHKLSSRSNRSMVTVNCASLQPTLIESELFGREKGAYTGAMTRMAGRFEIADGSTIFLDEIGELPLDLQGKLLRVLEEGTLTRLGSTKTIHVNVRVVAATNRDLQQEVHKGNFRRDLFYRLNVFPVTIPPLRNHLEDLAPLVWMFVRRFENKMGKQIEHIPQRCMDALLRYSWPGNVRELRNVIEQAMIVSRERTLEPFLMATSTVVLDELGELNLDSAAREHILRVLKSCNWRISGSGGAADILGIKRTTLQSKMKKLGIDRQYSDHLIKNPTH